MAMATPATSLLPTAVVEASNDGESNTFVAQLLAIEVCTRDSGCKGKSSSLRFSARLLVVYETNMCSSCLGWLSGVADFFREPQVAKSKYHSATAHTPPAARRYRTKWLHRSAVVATAIGVGSHPYTTLLAEYAWQRPLLCR